MKRVSIINLIILFFSLLFPNQTVLAASGSLPSYEQTLTQTPASIVKVVNITSNIEVNISVPNTVAVLSSMCKVSISETGDTVQKTAEINLNQPANCFSLQVSNLVSVYRPLVVKNTSFYEQEVVVVPLKSSVSSSNLAPAPVSPLSLPALPFMPLALSFVIFALSKKLKFENLNYIFRIKTALTLHQLQVLRC